MTETATVINPTIEMIKAFTLTYRLPETIQYITTKVYPFSFSCTISFDYWANRGNALKECEKVQDEAHRTLFQMLRNMFERHGYEREIRAFVIEKMIQEESWSDL